ncbi:MAG: hypothetical protein K0S80_2952 [Neobacillus sp.]|jgi:hypothetical protein|nr:hypothetical protein [Neobacillus sp.]
MAKDNRGYIEKESMPDEARKTYIDALQEAKSKADQSKPNDLTVKIGADCSDVLKAMKALRREAKETTHALNELDKAGLPIVDVGRMIVHRDDVIVVYTNYLGNISKLQIDDIEARFRKVFPENKIAVLPGGWSITAAGLEGEDHD